MSKKTTPTAWVNIVGWLFIVGAVIGVGLAVVNSNNVAEELISANLEITEIDNVKGNPGAKVQIVEYGDYQCPFCSVVEPMIGQALLDYEDQIAFVYRQLPLVSIHPNALSSAKAAEAAAMQGKFWEMHSLLYRMQEEWQEATNASEIYRGYAETLGLDLDQYDSDFRSDEVVTKINTDRRIADEIGLNSTPTFFVNGKEVRAANSIEGFKNIFEEAINEVGE